MRIRRRQFLKCAAVVLGQAAIAPSLTGSAVGALIPDNEQNSLRIPDRYLKDYLHRMRNFNEPHPGDVCLDPARFRLLESSVKRLKRLQRTVGHGNFYLLGFDEALKYARNYRKIGRFPKAELAFLESIFYADGAAYGFLGKKPLSTLSDRIRRREVVKIPRTGNYLYRGEPLDTYRKLRKELGGEVVLTSGVRSVMKQFLLFLDKAYRNRGNLSLASRSLAPPGYSFHGVGDFDVGQVGLGVDNFTERFAATTVYRRLVDGGYVNLRYDKGNLLGVRFEPWHVKISGRHFS